MGRVLGVDFGDRRFGLALSDPSGTLASPLEVVDGQDAFWERAERLVREEGVESIVIGLPRNMDGSLGPKAQQVLAFRRRMAERLQVPVETWDERLTTVQAERSLVEGGVSSRAKRRRLVDKVAAQILLQCYLGARARAPDASEESPEPTVDNGS